MTETGENAVFNIVYRLQFMEWKCDSVDVYQEYWLCQSNAITRN